MITREKQQSKQQLNARVRSELRQAVEELSNACNFTNEEIVEAAFAALIGTKDNVVDAKRVLAQMKAKELKLSFEQAARQPNGQLELIAA